MILAKNASALRQYSFVPSGSFINTENSPNSPFYLCLLCVVVLPSMERNYLEIRKINFRAHRPLHKKASGSLKMKINYSCPHPKPKRTAGPQAALPAFLIPAAFKSPVGKYFSKHSSTNLRLVMAVALFCIL